MRKSAKTLFIFTIYLILLGTILMVVPNVLLVRITKVTTHEVWIRVVGMMMILLAFYYIQAARSELRDFSRGQFTPGDR